MKKKPTEAKKVKLKFLDCEVHLEGSEPDLNGQALGLLSVLVADRIRYEETLQNLEIDELEETGQQKSKKLQFDCMFN